MNSPLNTSPTRLPDLTPRGASVVDMLVRFGLLVPAVLQEFFPGLSQDAARKFLERLVEDRWLRKHHFAGGQPYFVLSDSACHRLELKRNGHALRQRPLIRRCLVLFHFSAQPSLRLLTSVECRQHLPTLYRRGAASSFFIDSHTKSLGCVCLDDGKRAQRVHTKVIQIAARQRAIAEIRQLIEAGRFELLVLTTSAAKAEQLRALFEQRPVRETKVQIAAVSACAQLALAPN